MSVIEKLTIQGIRSYDVNEKCSINFESNLNVIHGINGSGKTTILESLKYLLIGATPPGTTLINFVNEFKCRDHDNVKGNVEAVLRGRDGQKYTAARGIRVTKTKNKTTAKTENIHLELQDSNKYKRKLVSRANDLTKEMYRIIGVSKSIVDFVVLCHQEECCWPLSEPKFLKERFDQIFETEAYNKALENVRAIRLAKVQKQKECHQQLEKLSLIKDRAAEINNKILAIDHDITSRKISVQSLEEQTKIMTLKLTQRQKKINKINSFQGKIRKYELINIQLQKQILEKEKNIRHINDEDLLLDDETNLEELHAQEELRLKSLIEKMEKLDESISEIYKQIDTTGKNICDKKLELALLQRKAEDLQSMAKNISQITGSNLPESFNNDDLMYFKSCVGEYKSKNENDIKITQAKLTEKTTTLNDFKIELHDLKLQLTQKTQEKTHKLNKQSGFYSQLKVVCIKIDDLQSSAKKIEEIDESILFKENLIRDLKDNKIPQLQSSIEEKSKKLMDLEEIKTSIDATLNELRVKFVKIETTEKSLKSIRSTEINIIETFNKYSTIFEELEIAPEISLDSLSSVLVLAESRRNFQIDENEQLKCSYAHQQSQLKSLDDTIFIKRIALKDVESNITHYKSNLLVDEKNFTDNGQLYHKKCIKHFVLKKFKESLCSNLSETKTCLICLSRIDDTEATLNKLKIENSIHQTKLNKFTTLLNENNSSKVLYETSLSSYEEIKKLEKTKHTLEADIETALNEKSKISSEISNNKTQIDRNAFVISRYSEFISNIKVAQSLLQSAHAQRASIIECNDVSSECIFNKITQTETDENKLKVRVKKLTEKILNLKNLANRNISELNNLRDQVLLLTKDKSSLVAFVTKICEYNNKKIEYEEEIEASKTEIDNLNREINNIIAKIDTDTTNLIQHTQQCDHLANNHENLVQNFNESMSRLNHDIQSVEKLINENLPSQTSLLNTQINSLEALSLNLNSSIQSIQQEIKQIKNQIDRKNKMIFEIKVRIEISTLNKSVSKNTDKINHIEQKITQIGQLSRLERKYNKTTSSFNSLNMEISSILGSIEILIKQKEDLELELKQNIFRDSTRNYLSKLCEIKVLDLLINDLDVYYSALDYAITKYHRCKIIEINRSIKKYWKKAYKSDDIDYIHVEAQIDDQDSTFKNRRNYNYKIFMYKDGENVDMRGKCSSGQKMMASIIIRIALCKAFCTACSFIALDEPTTNLDSHNIEGLAASLNEFSRMSTPDDPFQLIVISHDQKFILELFHGQNIESYLHVYKDHKYFCV